MPNGVIVLAGGKSSRMGQDKALLAYRGGTLLDHVVAIVSPLVHEVVVVAETPGRYTVASARVVGDERPGVGPVGGILTGLMALGEGSHLVVACDMPGLRRDLLRLLLDSSGEAWDAVAPEVAGRPEPLCAVYRHTAAPKLRQFLADGGRSARAALEYLETRLVGEDIWRRADPEGISFINLNSPGDLERFRQSP